MAADSMVQNVQEQQPPVSPQLLTIRALVAYVDDQEKRNILLGRHPLPGEDLTQLEETIAKYNAARASLPVFISTNPIVSEEDSLLDTIRARPDVMDAFTSLGIPWRAVMIDLRHVLAFQPAVRVDDLDERVATALKNHDALMQLCFPSNVLMEASFETNEHGHTCITSSPNFTLIPSQLPVQIGGQIILTPAFVPQLNSNFFNVAYYQGRYFIRDGYHRAVGLLRNTTEAQVIVPCILVEAQTLSQTGWKPGMIAEAVLLSERPPRLSDFWDTSVSHELLRRATRRVFRMRLDFFETAVL